MPTPKKKPATTQPSLMPDEGSARQSVTRDQLSDAEKRRLAELERKKPGRRRTK